MFGCRRSCSHLYKGIEPIKCSVILDGNSRKELVPWKQNEIVGSVVLEPQTPFDLKNLWIQLEGIAISRFQAKINGVNSSVFQSDHFLPPSMTCFAVGEPDLANCPSTRLDSGKHTFQFKLTPAHVTYPRSFKSNYGFIQYRIAVYVNNNFAECVNKGYCWELKNLFATLTLNCKGFRDLRTEEDLQRPLEVVKTKEKSFTKRLIAKATLNLDKGGYMCGERGKFSLYVENPVCDHVSKLVLELVHQVNYYGNPATATKSTSVVLWTLANQVDTADGEIIWDGEFSVPLGLVPSFCTKTKCMDINYVVRFTVETNGKILLKGETAIVIGTIDGAAGGKARSRVASCSNRDTSDTVSVASLPCYSALSSRRSSIETLPPCYEDALKLDEIFEDDQDDGFRPRSSSNVM